MNRKDFLRLFSVGSMVLPIENGRIIEAPARLISQPMVREVTPPYVGVPNSVRLVIEMGYGHSTQRFYADVSGMSLSVASHNVEVTSMFAESGERQFLPAMEEPTLFLTVPAPSTELIAAVNQVMVSRGKF